MTTYIDYEGQEINTNDFDIVHIDHDQIVNNLNETYDGQIYKSFVEENGIIVFSKSQPFTSMFIDSGESYYELFEQDEE